MYVLPRMFWFLELATLSHYQLQFSVARYSLPCFSAEKKSRGRFVVVVLVDDVVVVAVLVLVVTFCVLRLSMVTYS